MSQPPLFLSVYNTDKLNTLILKLIQMVYQMLYGHFAGLDSCPCVASLLSNCFAVAILGYFVSRGCGLVYGQL